MDESIASLEKPLAWLSFENDKGTRYDGSIVVLNKTFDVITIKWDDFVSEVLSSSQQLPNDPRWPDKLKALAEQLEDLATEKNRNQTKQKVYKAVHKITGKVYKSKRTGKSVWTNKGHLKNSMIQRKIAQSDYLIKTYLLDMTDVHGLAYD